MSVYWLVGRSVIISEKGVKFYASIEALDFFLGGGELYEILYFT